MKATGDPVEVLEPRGRPGELGALLRQPLELVQLVLEHVGHGPEVLLMVLVGDLEHRAFGLFDQVARRRPPLGHAGLDLVGGGQQAAHERVVAHDARVVTRVAGGGDGAGEGVDRGLSADLLQAARLAQVLADREHVDRLARGVELEHRLVDRTVTLAVEVVGLEVFVDQERIHGPLGEQDRSQHRLLGLEIVGRRDARGRRPVAGCRGGAGHARAHRTTATAPGRTATEAVAIAIVCGTGDGVMTRGPAESTFGLALASGAKPLTAGEFLTRTHVRARCGWIRGRSRAYFWATTMVFTVEVTSSATSTTTMYVPT